MSHTESPLYNKEEFDDVSEPANSNPRVDQAMELNRKKPVIDVYVNEGSMSPQETELLHNIESVAWRISDDYRIALETSLRQFQEQHRMIDTKILDHILETKLDMPRFAIYDRTTAETFLIDSELDIGSAGLQPGHLLLVFNLPKPLATYWRKTTHRLQNQDIIPWGTFYEQTVPVVWQAVGEQECETDIIFDRVNRCGQHDPEKYYYVWDIRQR